MCNRVVLFPVADVIICRYLSDIHSSQGFLTLTKVLHFHTHVIRSSCHLTRLGRGTIHRRCIVSAVLSPTTYECHVSLAEKCKENAVLLASDF